MVQNSRGHRSAIVAYLSEQNRTLWEVMMFLFRAAFWIAVVIVLVPGVLDPSASEPGRTDRLVGFHTLVLTSLARVKGDLKAQRVRSMSGN